MAKSYQAGVATLGIKLAYGVETVAGVKPEVFNVLHRISEIGDINLTAETIDASALEDLVERSVAGRASTGGTWDVTVNATDDNVRVENTYQCLTDADFIVAQPPLQIPSPSMGQNDVLKFTMTMAIEEYVGFETKVVPTDDAE